MTQAAQSLPTY